MKKEFWNERYAKAEYVYGEEPNDFLKEQLKPGHGVWLFPAEGEGRNAVYAASLGLQVVAFDQSEAGRAKSNCAKANTTTARVMSCASQAGNFSSWRVKPLAIGSKTFRGDTQPLCQSRPVVYLCTGCHKQQVFAFSE